MSVPVYVALDFPDADQAVTMVRKLSGVIDHFKVGLELLHSEGPEVVRSICSAGAKQVFFDGKFHDIPNTVAGAVKAAVRSGATLLNVHTTGGKAMMEAAVRAADAEAEAIGRPRPLVIGVTVLTSMDETELSAIGLTTTPEEQVVRLARLAQQIGLDGVVASPQEIRSIRDACGPDFFIITPGVRPAWAQRQDQKRVATPAEAVQAGANALVVGRPITAAADPVEAATRTVRECEEAEQPC